jgi:hypothetical protein
MIEDPPQTASAQQAAQTDRTAEIVERRVAAAALTIQAQLTGITELINHRINANKEQFETALTALEKAGAARSENLKTLLQDRLTHMDHARAIQATEYERRLTALNHEHARIELLQNTFVRIDTNDKDWDRSRGDNLRDWTQLREERQQENALDAAAKTALETSNDTMRRNTLLAIVSGLIAILSVVVSVALHYAPTGHS